MTERSLLQARGLLMESLAHAMREVGATQRAAAAMVGVKPNTIHRWLNGESSMDVERILAHPKLRHPFREYLCVHDHGPGALPYLAKRRSSK